MDKKPSTKADIRKDILGVVDSIFEEIEPDLVVEHLPPKEQTPTPRMIWNGVPID
jgi:hypothetical protein